MAVPILIKANPYGITRTGLVQGSSPGFPVPVNSKITGISGQGSSLSGLLASAGGHGYHGSYGYHKKGGGTNIDLGLDDLDLTLEICPDLLIAGLAVAGAAAFFLLYTGITMAGRRRRRRRKRDSSSTSGSGEPSSLCISGHVTVFELDPGAAVCYAAGAEKSTEAPSMGAIFLSGEF